MGLYYNDYYTVNVVLAPPLSCTFIENISHYILFWFWVIQINIFDYKMLAVEDERPGRFVLKGAVIIGVDDQSITGAVAFAQCAAGERHFAGELIGRLIEL